MQIAVVGGGPAGLYFALLAARAGEHQVTVYERNPPDATYGWGVVFSEGTLGELREADHLTSLRLEENLVRWSAIDIRHRGWGLRSYGHGFSAISRQTLLGVLQQRAMELGATIQFESERGPEVVEEGYDLVVAADGVNSRLRAAFENSFRPTIELHPTRYIWLGAPFAFAAFTFIFQETPYGLFQVHGYPYSTDGSTFIVECTESTWRRAGLDQADEATSLEFCEEIFAAHLGGRRLGSNRSAWLSFPNLTSRTWHHRNIVLLGDAAHTAHFSIGSGTKLAMEDATSLHQALAAKPDDLAAALAVYEAERQPAVARFQQAASDSARYFENVDRYLDLPAETFAFNLLTRSGRVTHADMERRDPALTVAADRQMTGDLVGEVVARPSLTPISIGGVVIPNRIVAAQPGIGAGLVFTRSFAVASEGRRHPHDPVVDEMGTVSKLSSAVQGVSLTHAGRRASARLPEAGLDRPPLRGGWETIAASPIPYTSAHPAPRAVTEADLVRLMMAYQEGAQTALSAGYEVLMIDAADGGLVASFLSPLTNQRSDSLGGDVFARARFLLAMVKAVRSVWPGPLVVRLAVSDWHAGGTTLAEAVDVARAMAAAGVDALDVAAGGTVPDADPPYRRGYLLAFADEIRNRTGMTTIVGGGLFSLDDADTALAAGRADLCRLDPVMYRRNLWL
ncbi:MAG: FAD-dependent monooxygenase [Acidimicrobiia bacterium]